jgi:LSD1 subclass zinc finger protein
MSSVTKMNIVGSLCFCSECGSLLDLSTGTNTIKCGHCKAPYSTKGTGSEKFLICRFFDVGNYYSIFCEGVSIGVAGEEVCYSDQGWSRGSCSGQGITLEVVAENRYANNVQTAKTRKCCFTTYKCGVQTKVQPYSSSVNDAGTPYKYI